MLLGNLTTLYCNRSGVVELVGREPLTFARVENGVYSPQEKRPFSIPGNYRRIMMLEVGYKIIAGHILLARLKVIKENSKHLDHEAQSSMWLPEWERMHRRYFTVKSLVTKRREHNQETWILFLGLVKAFDKVPRELLWRVLTKLGVPNKLVSILKAMHKNVEVPSKLMALRRSSTRSSESSMEIS